MGLSFAQLAQIQMANKANPYLYHGPSGSGEGPDVSNDQDGPPIPDTGDIVDVGGGGAASGGGSPVFKQDLPPEVAAKVPGAIPVDPASLEKGYATSKNGKPLPPPGADPNDPWGDNLPDQPPRSTMAGVSAGPSIERQNLLAHDESRAREINTLKQGQDMVQRQQDILLSGEQQARDLTKKAQIDDYLNQQDITAMQRAVQSHNNLANIDIEHDAALLRQEQPDPKHWFKEKGTAGTILAALAIGAGAFAAAMPHTENHTNQALGIITSAIDKDIDAQNATIEQKWKQIKLKVDQSDRQYVRDQFFLEEKRKARLTDYDHAIHLVDQQRLTSTNESNIAGMDAISQGMKQQQEKIKMEGADQRYQVLAKERAAAVSNNPWSDANIMKKAAKLQEQEETAYQKNPKIAGKPRTLGEIIYDLKHGGFSGGGTSSQDDDFDTGLKGVLSQYDNFKTKSVGPDGQPGSNPYYAILPNSDDAQVVRKREQLNRSIKALIHQSSTGIRSAELINDMAQPFQITRWDNDDSIAQKQHALEGYVVQHNLVGTKPRTETEDEKDEAGK